MLHTKNDFRDQSPLLRFRGFEQPWKPMPLKKLLRLVERPIKMKDDDVYSLITVKRDNRGVVSRSQLKGRQVLVKSQFEVCEGDFVISKRQIVHQACGIVPIELDGSIVSNEYNVFQPTENCCIRYFDYMCHRPQMRHAFYLSCVGVHIEKMLFKTSDWLKREFLFPSLKEQKKIGAFLLAVDRRIEQLAQRKLLLDDYKKAVIQGLLNQTLRLKDAEGKNFPDWKDRKLADVLNEHKGKSCGGEEVYSVSVHKGLINQVEHLGRSFAAASTSHYNLVKPGDIVYTKSPTGGFPYGIIKQSHVSEEVIVSPLYGVFTPETAGLGRLLEAYFQYPRHLYNYLHPIVQKGAKNTINITNATFLSRSLLLPVSHEEQERIAILITNIDRQIQDLATQIRRTEVFKRGLLQQMFV